MRVMTCRFHPKSVIPCPLSQAPGWTLDKINLNVERRFFKTHANLKDIPAGSARGLKVELFTMMLPGDEMN